MALGALPPTIWTWLGARVLDLVSAWYSAWQNKESEKDRGIIEKRKLGSTDIQIRTSGYAKFADEKIDSDILNGTATIDVTGILTIYSGSAQFTLVDEPSISVVKH